MTGEANPVQLIPVRRFGDARGWFAETYSAPALAQFGVHETYVQDNHSFSRPAYTLRGLHFQTPPYAQAKLVRCVRGAIFDVAVDVRRGSPTYARWVGATLTADNGLQLAVPAGFAHGFLTLEPETEIIYKVSAPYAPAHDSGLLWSDPDIAVDWPLHGASPTLSEKDAALRRLAAFESPFPYDGRPLTRLGPETAGTAPAT